MPVDVYLAALFMMADKEDEDLKRVIKDAGLRKAKHRFPDDPEAQKKFAEPWIAERTKAVDEKKLKASDYFGKTMSASNT